jgi:hypothetical protein
MDLYIFLKIQVFMQNKRIQKPNKATDSQDYDL